MAVESLPKLLNALTASLESSDSAAPDQGVLQVPVQELTLLTTKNELFLSYIHNLVFLILVKLRHTTLQSEDGKEKEEIVSLNQQVTEKLVELRLYLEKGIKPLEGRLKYQIDKVIRAAEEATSSKQADQGHAKPRKIRNEANVSGSEISDAASDAGSDSSHNEADLAAAPNRAALLRRANDSEQANSKTTSNGIYRPPKITPTALPVTQGREQKAERRPGRSAALDEFIADEFSTAPMVEPSIGSMIRAGGRHTLSQRERAVDADKRRYEEENFVRLPAATKKERAKQPKPTRSAFGGEEWQNLGRGLDRIDKLTQRSSNAAGMLARSRKRAVVDGPRDSGEQISMKRQKSSRR